MARTDPRPHYGCGRYVSPDGYVFVRDPAHPLAMKSGYVAEHRKVAWDHGLLTDPKLHVHHINHDKTDNRPENLLAVDVVEHQRDHHVGATIRNQFGEFPVGDVPPHGDYRRYVKHGCRCPLCRAANTADCRVRAKRRRLERASLIGAR